MLGWSWLFPPYRWHFDAPRRRRACARLAFDGACLRGKCEADPALGYDLMKRFAQVIMRAPAGDAAPTPRRLRRPRRLRSLPAPGPMVPLPFAVRERVAARRPTRGRSTLEPGAGEEPPVAPGQFMMLYVFGVGEVPISVSGDPARAGACSCTPSARSARSRARSARLRAGRGARRARAVRHRLADRGGGRARTSSSSPAGSASRRCGRSLLRGRSSGGADYGEVVLLYGARTPDDLLYPRRARAAGAATAATWT